MKTHIHHAPDPEWWQQRIRSNSETNTSGCWIWKGAQDRHGYGTFRFYTGGSQRLTGAHRAAFLAYRGDIEPGLTIDHLCRVPLCVNPDHLEAVTLSVNVKRSDHSNKKGRSGRKLGTGGCSRHGFVAWFVRAVRGVERNCCKLCQAERNRAYRERAAKAA